jgi:CBS domain-containing protein
MEPPDTLLGILTERDLMTRVLARALDPDRTQAVREVMTPNPICVPPETPVSDAVVIMLERASATCRWWRARRSWACSRCAMRCRARSARP